MRGMNEMILGALEAATGLRARMLHGEAVIDADERFAEKAGSGAAAELLGRDRREAITAALRDALEDLANAEIAGDADTQADLELIREAVDTGLRTLPGLKGALSEMAWDILSGHMRRIHAGLLPRLKIRHEQGRLSAVLVSVFVDVPIESKQMIVTEGDAESIARGVRRVITQIAPGLVT